MTAHEATTTRLAPHARSLSSAMIRPLLPAIGLGLKLASLDYGTMRWTLERTPARRHRSTLARARARDRAPRCTSRPGLPAAARGAGH
ncbi:MAG: hypothetical protein H0W98_01895 [Chloroflexi bacterium]|nr:hypothetical protein [Chloroflexota bacterium]